MKETILEILGLSIEVNKEQGPTVYLYYSGGVSKVEIDIFENGWGVHTKPDASFLIMMDGTERDKRIMTECIDYLKKLQEKSPCGNTD